MRKVILCCIFSFIFCKVVIAGSWQNIQGKWYYIKDNNTLAMNEWIQDDSNYDGIIENYYFDANAQMLENTVTPDGHYVGEDGNRVDNGFSNDQDWSIPNLKNNFNYEGKYKEINHIKISSFVEKYTYTEQKNIIKDLEKDGNTINYNLDGTIEIMPVEKSEEYIEKEILTLPRGEINDWIDNKKGLSPATSAIYKFKTKLYPNTIN